MNFFKISLSLTFLSLAILLSSCVSLAHGEADQYPMQNVPGPQLGQTAALLPQDSILITGHEFVFPAGAEWVDAQVLVNWFGSPQNYTLTIGVTHSAPVARVFPAGTRFVIRYRETHEKRKAPIYVDGCGSDPECFRPQEYEEDHDIVELIAPDGLKLSFEIPTSMTLRDLQNLFAGQIFISAPLKILAPVPPTDL